MTQPDWADEIAKELYNGQWPWKDIAAALRKAKEDGMKEAKAFQQTIHFIEAEGQTMDEMRKHVWHSPLYRMGDARLVWVNEGDFWLHPATKRCDSEVEL